MIFFGAIGNIFKKIDYGVAPLVLAMVVGPIFENAFRQSLIISSGDLSIFMVRPISAILLMSAAFLLMLGLFPNIWSFRVKLE